MNTQKNMFLCTALFPRYITKVKFSIEYVSLYSTCSGSLFNQIGEQSWNLHEVYKELYTEKLPYSLLYLYALFSGERCGETTTGVRKILNCGFAIAHY
jgi:hypothetical protein